MAVSVERNPVEALAEDFLERYRRGERPALSEYTQKHPELADRIRDLFPTLVMMEEFGPGKVEPAGPYRGAVRADGKPLDQLGDYRILREIGRGGMGLVYEAVQQSLGRHVALKVLPYGMAADATRLARFQCEARAAAHLHHTNIVPVFDVGVHDGVYYFAMQFIQGQSLDQVLLEVRRLRKIDQAKPSTTDAAHPAHGALSVSLAEALASGQFAPPIAEPGEQPADVAGTSVVTGSSAAAAASEGRSAESVGGAASSPHSELSTTSDYHYFRSVARIGVQVAEALAHAHSQRVLHRDIKPGNLLLDSAGTVWVTDFGLAKDDTSDLTKTGDIVGTLRYMAPERFDGVTDARSDVFSLGVTLYELVTLRPAFADTDRAQLLKQLTHAEPPRPRSLDPRLPRDLETIVLKAIAKDPRRRYQTAADLAEDLRRFLSDRPILARRVTALERSWRWVRRNPGWAATLATALGLLLVIAVGGMVMNVHLSRALKDVQDAEAGKTEKLWQSYLDRARAERSSGRVGQRFAALAAIREAAKIRVSPELRTEAIAALVLPDVEVAHEWDAFPEGTLCYAFDAKFERYARMNKQGDVTLCRRGRDADGRDREEVVAPLGLHGKPTFHGLWMSPDGHSLAVGHSCQVEAVSTGLRVWKLDGPEPKVLLDTAGVFNWSIAFHSDNRRLAVGHPDKTIGIYDLQTGACLRRLPLGAQCQTLAFHPRDGWLAAGCGGVVRLINTDTGHEMSLLRHPDTVTSITGVAWHPDGRRLATGGNDLKIRIWAVDKAAELMTWEGCTTEGIVPAFSHEGDRLLSNDWNGQSRLWDVASGRVILTMPRNYGLRLSPDDRLLGPERSGTKVRIRRLAAGHELRLLRSVNVPSAEAVYCPIIDRDGQLMVAASLTSLSLFHLASGRELASVRVPAGGCYPRTWDSSGNWLTSGQSGLLRWPVRGQVLAPPEAEHHVERLDIGPPQLLHPTLAAGLTVSRDVRWVGIPGGDHALVVDRDKPNQPVRINSLFDVRFCHISPDGNWVVTTSWFSDGRSSSARIWDAKTGRHIKDLPLDRGQVTAGFSPDGRWFATAAPGFGTSVWEVGAWQERRKLEGTHFAFQDDGRLLAQSEEVGVIRLIEIETGREICRLTAPEPAAHTPWCFSPDGTRLVAMVATHKALRAWDLRRIREQLRELNLDWEWDAFKPAAPSPKPAAFHAQIDVGHLAASLRKTPEETVRDDSALIEAKPADAEAWLRRGLAQVELAKKAKEDLEKNRLLKSAVADFTRVIALKPKEPRAYRERGPIAWELRDHAQAIADLRKLADDGSATSGLYNNLAWYYVTAPEHLRDPHKALPLVQKSLQMRPGYWNALNTLGVVYYRLGRFQWAIGALEESSKANNNEPTALNSYFLAMCHYQLGHLDTSKEHLDRAMRWHQQPTLHLNAGQTEELEAFQAEARRLMGGQFPGEPLNKGRN